MQRETSIPWKGTLQIVLVSIKVTGNWYLTNQMPHIQLFFCCWTRYINSYIHVFQQNVCKVELNYLQSRKFKSKSFGKRTGVNTFTHALVPNGTGKVSVGAIVSLPCWQVTSAAVIYGNLSEFGKKSSSVKRSQLGAMSDRWRDCHCNILTYPLRSSWSIRRGTDLSTVAYPWQSPLLPSSSAIQFCPFLSLLFYSQVSLGRFLLPSCSYVIATFVSSSLPFLNTCPMYLHPLACTVILSSVVRMIVLSLSCWLLIIFGRYICSIIIFVSRL